MKHTSNTMQRKAEFKHVRAQKRWNPFLLGKKGNQEHTILADMLMLLWLLA